MEHKMSLKGKTKKNLHYQQIQNTTAVKYLMYLNISMGFRVKFKMLNKISWMCSELSDWFILCDKTGTLISKENINEDNISFSSQ